MLASSPEKLAIYGPPDGRRRLDAEHALHRDHARRQNDAAIFLDTLVHTTKFAIPVSSSSVMKMTLSRNLGAGGRERSPLLRVSVRHGRSWLLRTRHAPAAQVCAEK